MKTSISRQPTMTTLVTWPPDTRIQPQNSEQGRWLGTPPYLTNPMSPQWRVQVGQEASEKSHLYSLTNLCLMTDLVPTLAGISVIVEQGEVGCLTSLLWP